MITFVSCGAIKKTPTISFSIPFGCSDSIPILGESLGEVTFQTNQTWIIGNQKWSDAVMATACQKESFNGGNWRPTPMIFNTDCRSNEGYGDLFSWCAVARFQNELCPPPWRVPTSEDFRDLDIALGGNGRSRGWEWSTLSWLESEQTFQSEEMLDSLRRTKWKEEVENETRFIKENYLGRWGGVLGGDCNSWGRLFGQGSIGRYWSSTEAGTNARNLEFNISFGLTVPQGGVYKFDGAMLRCVRDN